MLTFCSEFEKIQVKEFDVNDIYDQTIKKNDEYETASRRCREFGEHLLFTTEEQFKAIAKKSRHIKYIEEKHHVKLHSAIEPQLSNIAFFKLNQMPDGGIRILMKDTSINISPEEYLDPRYIEKIETRNKNTVIDMIISTAKEVANYDWKN